MKWLNILGCLLRLLVLSRRQLILENLALRQQLAVLIRQRPRPPLRPRDRLFWVCLSKLYSGWRSSLVLVQPETVIRWHRQGFRLWWRWKSRTKSVGRPPLSKEVRDLIGRMARENSTWGAPRIQAELRLLGHDVALATVAKYSKRCRPPKPPSQTWKVFLKNHVGTLASMDFFTVPTATFRLLYVLIILRHERRQVVHFQVTSSPTAAWVVQQLRQVEILIQNGPTWRPKSSSKTGPPSTTSCKLVHGDNAVPATGGGGWSTWKSMHAFGKPIDKST